MFFFQTKESPVVLNSSTVIKSSVKILADLQLSLRSSGTIFTEVQRFFVHISQENCFWTF